jgi:uncharacterized Ntn-hydrolase superfamily protein
VGAVATQAAAEITYGPEGLRLMAAGASAADALAQLRAADDAAQTRQVAMIDRSGAVAAHTGSLCVPEAGHVLGDGVACQANMMASDTVWPAMLAAYEAAAGPLAGRLLAALDAAQAQGGDARGSQSAALLVVPGEGEEWRATVSLRVEDHPEPLVELRRLLGLHAAYSVAGEGDEHAARGDHAAAAESFQEAARLAPDSHELLFWSGLGAAQGGDMETGVARVRAAIALQPGWRLLLGRMPREVAPSAAAVLAAIEDDKESDDG